jgi:predicted alpha/beta-hydrolase family hydrolase
MKIQNNLIQIPIDSIHLEGELNIPEGAKGIVVFSHGSGSSRHSPRNKFVAQNIQQEGLATLMFDLLTPHEDEDYHKRFDIELLVQRLIFVTNWIKEHASTRALEIGYFGSSTGAAAALGAAALLKDTIKAIVSRGGRPDLAKPYLEEVNTPTLLIVGSRDYYVIELNDEAFTLLKTPEKRVITIEAASHLFQEPGTLGEVAHYAALWFRKYLNKEELVIK